MAVAFDAKMTNGNDTTFEVVTPAATSFTTPNSMVVGASATCLVAVVEWNAAVSAVTLTWNSVAMTAGPTIASNGHSVAIFYLVNPTTGTQTFAGSWTGSSQMYASLISFTGTDTSTPIKIADNATATGTNTLTVTGDASGATVVVYGNDGSTQGTPTFTTIYTSNALSDNSASDYNVGGTSDVHTFTGGNGTDQMLVGVHVVAPGAGGGSVIYMLGHT